MTEVIDDVSDHVLSVRGSYLLTRMKYITHVLRRYCMHHVTLFFFIFFIFRSSCLFRDLFADSFSFSEVS